MSMTNNGGGQAPEGAASTQPQMNVLGQYIKDFSFENPSAPRGAAQQPSINIQINVSPRQLSPTDFEVELKIEGKAEAQGTVLFAFDLAYAGLFRLQNIPQEHVAPILMIECPRLLFPFSREIIASTTVQGGFPPLLLEPVDFAAMYQQRMAQAQAQPTANA
jgi:preprotein translocase subunit SecB